MSDTNTALANNQTGGELAENEPYKGSASYVSFVWAKTQNDDLKANLLAQNATLPTFVLTRAGFPQSVKPFQYHLLKLVTIATQMDNNGKIVNAEPKLPAVRTDNDRWAEHSFAVVVVVQGETLTPALVTLRAGARKALTNAETFAKDAAKPGWENRGAMFKAAAEATPVIEARTIATGSITPEKNSVSGNMQLIGRCSPRPSTAVEAGRLTAALKNPDFQKDVEATFKALDWKLKGLLSKQIDEPADE